MVVDDCSLKFKKKKKKKGEKRAYGDYNAIKLYLFKIHDGLN